MFQTSHFLDCSVNFLPPAGQENIDRDLVVMTTLALSFTQKQQGHACTPQEAKGWNTGND
jgi:hypothetical protein